MIQHSAFIMVRDTICRGYVDVLIKAVAARSSVVNRSQGALHLRKPILQSLELFINLSADDVIGDAVCALFENWVGLGLDFSQEDMPHFRQLIALSLLNKEFLK